MICSPRNSLCFQQNESKPVLGVFFIFKIPVATNPQTCLLLWSFLSPWADRVLAKFGFRRPSEIILCPGCVFSVWWLSPWLKFHGENEVAEVQGRLDKCFQLRNRFVRGVYVCVCVCVCVYVLVWFYWSKPMRYVLKSLIVVSVF